MAYVYILSTLILRWEVETPEFPRSSRASYSGDYRVAEQQEKPCFYEVKESRFLKVVL